MIAMIHSIRLYHYIKQKLTAKIYKYLDSEIYSSIHRMSDCPDWFVKVWVIEVISQKRFGNPGEILVNICWELRNAEGRDPSVGHHSHLSLVPVNTSFSDSNRFGRGIVKHRILCALEQMLTHIEKYLLMGIFLTEHFSWKFLNIESSTHFPFSLTIIYTCSELCVWMECGSVMLGSVCLHSLEFSL